MEISVARLNASRLEDFRDLPEWWILRKAVHP